MIIRERSLGATPALLSLLLIGAAGCGPASREDKAAAPAPECTAPLVQTTSGPVCGLERTGWDTGPSGATAHAYLGIRYATARRWERPEAFRSDRPTRATQPGKICPQATRWADAETQDEDYLFPNVWTPATPGPRLRPVMVFLHGGAFVLGAGSGPISDGQPPGPHTGRNPQGVRLRVPARALLRGLAARVAAVIGLPAGAQEGVSHVRAPVRLRQRRHRSPPDLATPIRRAAPIHPRRTAAGRRRGALLDRLREPGRSERDRSPALASVRTERRTPRAELWDRIGYGLSP